MPHPHGLVAIEPQLNFPEVDISERNAGILQYLLKESGIAAQGTATAGDMAVLHHAAAMTLNAMDQPTATGKVGYLSFAKGYAVVEAAAMVVARPPEDGEVLHARLDSVYGDRIGSGDNFAKRYGQWINTHGNTMMLVANVLGDGVELPIIRAAGAGALVASNLLAPYAQEELFIPQEWLQ